MGTRLTAGAHVLTADALPGNLPAFEQATLLGLRTSMGVYDLAQVKQALPPRHHAIAAWGLGNVATAATVRLSRTQHTCHLRRWHDVPSLLMMLPEIVCCSVAVHMSRCNKH